MGNYSKNAHSNFHEKVLSWLNQYVIFYRFFYFDYALKKLPKKHGRFISSLGAKIQIQKRTLASLFTML